MDLSALTRKTLAVSRGHLYTYYTSPASATKPTLLHFHGWPDTAALWADLMTNHLIPSGYGCIALDCPGYGGSSKPTTLTSYAWDLMTADAAEIPDAENISQVISLGHDWGSTFAQRFYNFCPDRVIGLVMLSVALFPPTGERFDLDAINKATAQIFGKGVYEYWHLFTADEGAHLQNRNLESVYSVGFGMPETQLDVWCTPGGMRQYLEAGKIQETLPFAQGEHKRDFMARMTESGFEAPNCWYKATTTNLQSKVDRTVNDRAKVEMPVLFWGGKDDVVCRPEMLGPSIEAGLLPRLKSVVREGGHFALLERPGEFGKDVLEWLGETYG